MSGFLRFHLVSTENHIRVSKTARYFTLGNSGPAVTDVWFACHGYGQLAADFVKEFECIDAPGRLIVVPEALSRFYLQDAPGFHAADAKIGATWMTREDRDAEITDYVNYLDTLYEHVFSRIDRSKARVTVLGFSQGGATVNRWLMHGKARADRLIMWGSLFASDIDLTAAAKLFQAVDLNIVYGKRDQFANPAIIAKYESTVRQLGVPYNLIAFEGGHRMDRGTLERFAAIRL
jgi:predicted esterase